MSFLLRPFIGGGEARAIGSLSWGNKSDIPSVFEDAAMHSGGGSGGAMSLGAFYACVTLLADIVATLGISAYKHKDGAKVLVDPQPALFINSPYPDTTWFSWLWMMMESLAVTGNAFGYITARGRDGRPTGIMPIHPDHIMVTLPEDDLWPEPVYHIKGKKVRASDVVHVKRFPIANCAWGMSPVQQANPAVQLGLAAERFGYRYFRDSANPSGILSTENDLTPEQIKRAQKQWITSHQGRRLPAVLYGNLKWQTVTLTPNESQFLETRQFQRSEIAMWFRVPPHMIGDTTKSTSWGTGIEEMTLGFVKYTLTPWLSCIEQILSTYLPHGQFAKFNIDDLLRGDVKSRWEAYAKGRESGVYSVNDIRDMEDLPPIGPEGDIRLQPSNYVPLGTDPSLYAGGGASKTDTPADDGEDEGA